MTLQKDINAALRCAAPSTNGRLVVVRNANGIESVVLDCSHAVLNKLCRVAQRNSVAVWEMATSKEWGPLSLHEWVDADDDPTLPSQIPQSKRRSQK